jgi:hypothetical protein
MDAKELEEHLAQKLTEGEMDSVDAEESARRQLPMKTEIRIQAKIDLVVEETKRYQQMAKEVDGRYERFYQLIEGNESEGKKES